MIRETAADDWIEWLIKGSTVDVFGEPTRSPEEHVIEIEEVTIAISGCNLAGQQVNPLDYLFILT